MHEYRTHTCGALRSSLNGEKIKLSGWVYRKRDHGGVLFIDLRDYYGVTQCVLDTNSPLFSKVEKIPLESVITIEGQVRLRPDDLINKQLDTGQIEVLIEQVHILSKAQTLPFPVTHDTGYPEDIRYKYRYLDLRILENKNIIVMRSHIISYIRKSMEEQGFIELQTPILSASSPEGARDFIVPSRLHPGHFYALPQAPQIYKQLSMIAGFDKYFQISPCFRDEDARVDRSPGEFYQCDFEMAFATQDDVFAAIEPVLYGVFQKFAEKQVQVDAPPFIRIPYHQAMIRFGSDKPDLRNPLELIDVSQIFNESGFKLFDNIVNQQGTVTALPIKGLGAKGRGYVDKLNQYAKDSGFAGLGYILFDEHGKGLGPIAKNLNEPSLTKLQDHCDLGAKDGVLFGASAQGMWEPMQKFMGEIREKAGQDMDLLEKNAFRFCWITDFPMYEKNADKQLVFAHNPFSMPQGGLDALENNNNPLDILAYQYDIVCNGVELSSGALRNYHPDIIYKAFSLVGYSREFVDKNFPALTEAFKYGAPPHGGAAPGIDRIIMLLLNAPNIREIVLFPKNQLGEDLMLGAPSVVTNEQLQDVHIALKLKTSESDKE